MSLEADIGKFGLAYSTGRLRRTGRRAADRTIRTKKHYIRAACRDTGSETLHDLAIALTDRPVVLGLLNPMWERGLDPSSITGAYFAFRAFIAYAVDEGWIVEAALLKEDCPGNGPPKPISVYSNDEIEELLDQAARRVDVRFWALLSFLAFTGRRIGEAIDLEWSWLRLGGKVPYFELPTQKNGNPQYIPLGPRMMSEVFTTETFEALREPTNRCKRSSADYLFPHTYSSVQQRFRRLCGDAGLPYRKLHNLRHSYVTHQLLGGTPVEAVSSLVGHSSVRVTYERYLHCTALNYTRYVI